jgi:Co/Zn/Cd efflux system component
MLRTNLGLRQTVKIVAVLNLAYFFIEFSVARQINSVALFADSIDFLEDTSVNILILLAFGWSVKTRAKLGYLFSGFLLIPGVAVAISAWDKFQNPVSPESLTMGLTGLGALAVNVFCAYLLVRFKKSKDSLTKTAYLSARNDAVANVAIILASVLSLFWVSGWPDLIVGLGILLLNLDSATEVLEAARKQKSRS